MTSSPVTRLAGRAATMATQEARLGLMPARARMWETCSPAPGGWSGSKHTQRRSASAEGARGIPPACGKGGEPEVTDMGETDRRCRSGVSAQDGLDRQVRHILVAQGLGAFVRCVSSVTPGRGAFLACRIWAFLNFSGPSLASSILHGWTPKRRQVGCFWHPAFAQALTFFNPVSPRRQQAPPWRRPGGCWWGLSIPDLVAPHHPFSGGWLRGQAHSVWWPVAAA